MTEIRETMRVAGKAALKSNVIDKSLLAETQNFTGKFVKALSEDSRLMEKARIVLYAGGFYSLPTPKYERLKSEVFKGISKKLTEMLNTSNDPGAKFLKGLFLRYKGQKTEFLEKIPNILYLIFYSRDDKSVKLACNKQIKDNISESTKEAHSYLLKESPYIYRKACGEAKSGRMAAGKLNRFRQITGITARTRNTGRVSGKASAASRKIDECSLKELRKFMIEFIDCLSENPRFMKKVKDSFTTGNIYSQETMARKILDEISKLLIELVNTYNDPGAKFLKGLFLRHKNQIYKFIDKIPEILYLITLSATDKSNRIGYYEQMEKHISAATEEAHSDLLKESPYVYNEVIDKTRAGRSTSRKLNRLRKRVVINAAAKKTSAPRAAKKPVLVVPVRIIKVEARKI